MPIDRAKATAHAQTYWYVPCKDGQVWLSNAPIDVAEERRTRRKPESEWTAVFLEYGGRLVDGLFFIRNSVVPTLPRIKYNADSIDAADKEMVWPWEGLNDCAHFLSECLKAGGVNVWDLGVAPLVEKLQKLSDAKTLANLVDLRTAERIVKEKLMKPGDFVAYGTEQGYWVHGHSAMFVTPLAVSNHSRFNHKDFTGSEGGDNNWKVYASAARGHDKVTLIHFGHDDTPTVGTPFVGWWEVVYWGNTTYYYYFNKNGRVGYTSKRPADTGQPLYGGDGTGFWFLDGGNSNRIRVVWTKTGSIEVMDLSGGAMSGTYNDFLFCSKSTHL